jgi:hypothetical protein
MRQLSFSRRANRLDQRRKRARADRSCSSSRRRCECPAGLVFVVSSPAKAPGLPSSRLLRGPVRVQAAVIAGCSGGGTIWKGDWR